MSGCAAASSGEQAPAQVDVGSPEHQEAVQTVIQGIQDAAASDTALAPAAESDEDAAPSDEGSYYWDASTMAPLNAASAVSPAAFIPLL
jgi:hypothetical protein